jgi:hypothetical protein
LGPERARDLLPGCVGLGGGLHRGRDALVVARVLHVLLALLSLR